MGSPAFPTWLVRRWKRDLIHENDAHVSSMDGATAVIIKVNQPIIIPFTSNTITYRGMQS